MAENNDATGNAATTTEGVDLTPAKDGGVLKKIIKEGWGNDGPFKGDTVYVHYVGTLLDGTQFDSSRDRNEQFSFKLGTGAVIKAWDIGVASMKKGELCVLICKPEYAYGEKGSGPTIGPNATLVFEVELFSWEGEDLSEKKDGGITRRILKQGEGYINPNDGATVNVHLKGEFNDQVFDERDVTFTLGEGEEQDICPGIEQALKQFKNKEQSKLLIKSQHAFGTAGNEKFKIAPESDVTYEVTLNSFEKAKESWDMDLPEKLTQSEIVKQKGTVYFKTGKYPQALTYYTKVLTYLENELSYEGEDLTKRNSLVLAARLNVAMCHLKQQDFLAAIESCDKALETDPKNEKALFRRGMAKMGQSEYEGAIEDFKEVLTVDQNNKSARKELNQAVQKFKQFREKEKNMYAKMFKTAPGTKSNSEQVEGKDTSNAEEKVTENGSGDTGEST